MTIKQGEGPHYFDIISVCAPESFIDAMQSALMRVSYFRIGRHHRFKFKSVEARDLARQTAAALGWTVDLPR